MYKTYFLVFSCFVLLNYFIFLLATTKLLGEFTEKEVQRPPKNEVVIYAATTYYKHNMTELSFLINACPQEIKVRVSSSLEENLQEILPSFFKVQ